MSIHSLTGDDFVRLDPDDHRSALRVYNSEISGLIDAMAAAPDRLAPAYQDDSDELCRLLTLRKVHRVRLAELEEDEAAPRPVAQQYFDNELSELPS